MVVSGAPAPRRPIDPPDWIAPWIGLPYGDLGRGPAFDCWGETVNLAARLESSGSPSGVHISEAAWQRLRDAFVTRELPPVPMKGIGEVRTYLLEAPLEGAHMAPGVQWPDEARVANS